MTETYQQGLLRPRSAQVFVVLVGVPCPPDMLDMPWSTSSLTAVRSRRGTALPAATSTTLIDLYLQGRLPLQRFVSAHRAPFPQMHGGGIAFGGDVVMAAAIERVITRLSELDGGS